MANKFFFLDTFTGTKCRGNPTPVCILENILSNKTLHSLAIDFNAPVTAFVEPVSKHFSYPIRFFTKSGEIPTCGHATLGAAYVLLNSNKSDQIDFETIEKIKINARQKKKLTYVTYPKFERTTKSIPLNLMKAIGIKISRDIFYSNNLKTLFIEVVNEEEVTSLSPNFKLLLASTNEIKEVVVMCEAINKNYDFVLRSFCPWIGIDEDPVTGSIHSVLGHYWQNRLHKSEITAFQASDRGGQIFIKPLRNTVEIGGYSKIIVEGSLTA